MAERSNVRKALVVLHDEIVACRICPRLVAYLAEVGAKKKREFADWTYWAHPVPGFGDPAARLLVVGLAPAAHGGARTGRAFTGDQSGQWLMRAMHKQGFASIPRSVSRDDGLELTDAWISIALRCAPPENKPLPEELAACRPYLVREMGILPVQVVLALGKVAFDSVLKAAAEAWGSGPEDARGRKRARGRERPVSRRPEFAHGAELTLDSSARRVTLLASYHPSRQNTNTGKLTEPMLDSVFTRARQLLGKRRG